MKLKTLKDLESREKDLDFKDDFVIRESELKQEAIKWVFQWTKNSVEYFNLHKKIMKSLAVNIWRDGKAHRIILTKEVIDYIKFYNNITEEDLVK